MLYGRQAIIFFSISAAAYGVSRLQQATFKTPVTHTPENAAIERTKYHFPGDKRDPLNFNHAQNSNINWPKWDRRDDPEDNVFQVAATGGAAAANDDDEE